MGNKLRKKIDQLSTEKFEAWLTDSGNTLVLLKMDDEYVENFKTSAFGYVEDPFVRGLSRFINFTDSQQMWDKNLMVPALEALEAYMDYIGESKVPDEKGLRMTLSAHSLHILEEAIARETPLIDLWCLIVGTFRSSAKEGEDEKIKALISSRKPLKSYDKNVISFTSPFNYLNPLFPNGLMQVKTNLRNLQLSIGQPNFSPDEKKLARAVSLLKGDISVLGLNENVAEVDDFITIDRKISETELKALNYYTTNVFKDEMVRLFQYFNKDQFVEYFSRALFKQKGFNEQVNDSLFNRVVFGVELVPLDFKNYHSNNASYWTLTKDEALVFDKIKKIHDDDPYANSSYSDVSMAINDKTFFYLWFLKKPDAMLSFAHSTKTASYDYNKIMSEYGENKEEQRYSYSAFVPPVLTLLDSIERNDFNLGNIFEKFMEDQSIPFEILMSIGIDLEKLENRVTKDLSIEITLND